MSLQQPARVIGTFEGEMPGPLVIAIGALHGNEPAGVKALEMVFEALEQERRDNPDFRFHGKLVGLIGNAKAYLLRQRFMERDLNRMWTAELLAEINASKQEDLTPESQEVRQLSEKITAEYQSVTTEKSIFLDLHTTSADGGIFSIPTDEGESLQLAKHLGAPAIVGLQESVSGTLLGYAIAGGFKPAVNPPICVAFEAGQHDSPHSISRSAIAVVRCLRTVGCMEQNGLAVFAGNLTLPFLKYVPPVVRFRYAHHIEAKDEFKMRPGYANFQPIQLGEHLADDVNGPVLSPERGLILMPLYQAKGSDGFFIVE
ncbi:MAG: succinylglutamate desuccinylase/aspartoacylase family protein [Saprospiraceae bacterium]|nr:succinylglutamate desuccinylase/aspartoacylase family protein [Saprospiraceae bacterium]